MRQSYTCVVLWGCSVSEEGVSFPAWGWFASLFDREVGLLLFFVSSLQRHRILSSWGCSAFIFAAWQATLMLFHIVVSSVA
jgi:hypothetical protein